MRITMPDKPVHNFGETNGKTYGWNNMPKGCRYIDLSNPLEELVLHHYEEAWEIYKAIGLEPIAKPALMIMESKEFIGSLDYVNHIIKVHKAVLNDTREVILELLIHEIAHYFTTEAPSHGAEWKELCQAQYRVSGIKVTTTGITPSFKKWFKDIEAKYKYSLVCLNCDNEIKFATKCSTWKNFHRYTCAKCGMKFGRTEKTDKGKINYLSPERKFI